MPFGAGTTAARTTTARVERLKRVDTLPERRDTEGQEKGARAERVDIFVGWWRPMDA